MLRVAAAVAAATLVALVASAAIGQGQTVDGRFQLTAEEGGFLRLDTQTGALSFCQLNEGRWICTPVETGGIADLTAIVDRLAALEAALAALTEELDTPRESDVDAELAAIRNQLTALAEQITDVAPPIDEDLAEQLDTLAADQRALVEAVATLAGQEDLLDLLQVLDDRLAAMEATAPEAPLARIAEELQALRDLHGELARRLNATLEVNTNVANAFAAIGARLDAVETAIAGAGLRDETAATELAALVAGLDGRLEAQQAQMEALVEALDPVSPPLAANDAVRDLEERQTAVEQQLAALTEILGTATAPIPDLADVLATLGERQAAIQAELAALAAIVEAAGQEPLAEAVAALAERQMAIEEALTALTIATTPDDGAAPAILGQLALIAEDIAILREQTATLEARLDEPPEPDPAADIGADLARIEAEITALREAVLALAEQQSPVSDDAADPITPETVPESDDPDAVPETTGFGEQLFLRLEALVQDLRQGLGAE